MEIAQLALILGLTTGIGEKTTERVLRLLYARQWEGEYLLSLPAEQLISDYGLTRKSAHQLTEQRDTLIAKSAALLKKLRQAGVFIATHQSSIYPTRWEQYASDPPPVAYLYGRLNLLERATLAVAVSRDASSAALKRAEEAADVALKLNFQLVTGHNIPTYQRVALTAKRQAKPTITVLDRGLWDAFDEDFSRQLFPAARIWEPAFDPRQDLVMTPFHPHCHGIGQNNRRRDHCIFSLADVVIAIGVRPGGTMEKECRHVAKTGRPVLAFDDLTFVSKNQSTFYPIYDLTEQLTSIQPKYT